MHRSINKLTSLDHSPYVPNTNPSILPKDSKCDSHALVQYDGAAITAGTSATAGTAATFLPSSSVVSGTIGLAAMAGFAVTADFVLYFWSMFLNFFTYSFPKKENLYYFTFIIFTSCAVEKECWFV